MKVRFWVLLVAFLLVPFLVHAERFKQTTLEGKMNGLNCAINGILCPIDQADPLVALETDFVLSLPDGTFYLLPNVDRAVKARVILEIVAVTGTVDTRYKSIQVDKLEAKRGGKLKLIWSMKAQEELYRRLFDAPDRK